MLNRRSFIKKTITGLMCLPLVGLIKDTVPRRGTIKTNAFKKEAIVPVGQTMVITKDDMVFIDKRDINVKDIIKFYRKM